MKLDLIEEHLPDLLADIPKVLGYGGMAALVPRRENNGEITLDERGQQVLVSSKTLSKYFHQDLLNGRWHLMPRPDFIGIRRGGEWLPFWLPSTVVEWRDSRPGAGNRTFGEGRRGGISAST